MSIDRARAFRRRMPPAEARLWKLLRTEPFKAYHFRRQVPLGRYYADLASHAAKLVIEVDGFGHFSDRAEAHDAQRTRFIESQGYRVLRVRGSEVLNNLDGVYSLIAEAAPPPTGFAGPPSPQGGGSAD